EDAGILRLILLENIRLDGAANLRQRLGAHPLVLLPGEQAGRDELIGSQAEQRESGTVMPLRQRATIAWRGTAAGADRLVQLGNALFGGRPTPLLPQEALDALVDGRIHEHRKDHRRGTVD